MRSLQSLVWNLARCHRKLWTCLAIDAAEAAVDAHPKDAKAVLIVELEGPEEQVQSEKIELNRILENSGPIEVQVAKDTAARLQIWKGRKSAFSAVGSVQALTLSQMGIPRKRLGEALRRIEELGNKHD